MKAPVALIIYNRPETTKRVFESIRGYKPERLFVIADGPPDTKTREITEHIDWPCEVSRLYRDNNLGCDINIPYGLDWVFSQVDRAIILEDDCLPDPTFFTFCEELLERYKDDTGIHCISGINTQGTTEPTSYHFSRISLIHGWATWRNRWEYYDARMRAWPQLSTGGRLEKEFSFPVATYWRYKFQNLFNSDLTSWDGKWAFAGVARGALTITPKVNLVENIAPRKDATAKGQSMDFPLHHPKSVHYTPLYESATFKYTFGINRTFKQKLINLCKVSIASLIPSFSSY